MNYAMIKVFELN